jgi:uncharacterized protein YaiI (UPF0178 family)
MASTINIWVDGDACPRAVKDILFRAAMKRKIPLFMVANHLVTIPTSPFIKRIMVEHGFDVADNHIVAHVLPHDLVITSDIILADYVITKKAQALSPKGLLYTASNIKQILAMRNLNESLRSSGLITGGPGQLNSREIQLFSNHLDKIITQHST